MHIEERSKGPYMCAQCNPDQLAMLDLKINYLHFGIHDVRAN